MSGILSIRDYVLDLSLMTPKITKHYIVIVFVDSDQIVERWNVIFHKFSPK